MIYRSNLVCPDLAPRFAHIFSRPMPHSYGHDVISDWADKDDHDPVFGLYKKCGFWTHDEAAILYHVARRIGGFWLDIGAHTGWTTAHIWEGLKASRTTGRSPKESAPKVVPLDPMFAVEEFSIRFLENNPRYRRDALCGETSAAYFHKHDMGGDTFDGVCVDGDHEAGEPLRDASNAARHLAATGVIIFHDFIGRPVREAVAWLMRQGFHCRVYFTPHMVACCWVGEFSPPDHVFDPNLPDLKARCRDFDFSRCE